MAITLDATVGGANANTYIGLSDANSFIEGLVLSDCLLYTSDAADE